MSDDRGKNTLKYTYIYTHTFRLYLYRENILYIYMYIYSDLKEDNPSMKQNG